MSRELRAALAEHRPGLLRHGYRMLGSIADAEDVVQSAMERAWSGREGYRGDASIKNWLYRIATHACLNALASKARRALPQLESSPAEVGVPLYEDPQERWITPAADAQLFADPGAAAESRETVALAFIALLQRVPPKQRAALLLKDVLGWRAEEIASTMELSLGSVNSALHRARESVAHSAPFEEPAPATLGAFVRAWESRDLDALVALLRRDVELAMPPYPMWFKGVEAVAQFFRAPRFSTFWATVARAIPTRANGLPAFAFYVSEAGGPPKPHAMLVARFEGGQTAAMTVFLGAGSFLGFGLQAP